MPKFTKRPVTIEAHQIPPEGVYPSEDMLDFLYECSWEGDDEGIYIHTLEGDMLGLPGDWIIKGVNGEYYPCKPDIFEKTYDPA